MPGTADSPRRQRRRLLILAAIYLGLVLGGILAGQGLLELVHLDLRPSTEARVHRMIMGATGLYIAASAVPFVPGAEIGLALIMALGPAIALLVYVSMVAALLLTYLVGRFVPARVTAGLFHLLGLARARALVLRMAPLDPDARLALLIQHAPPRIVPFLLRHRYVAFAVALNTPGNTLLGGGGGLALAAGMSGLFRLPAYVLTVVLAVAPIPLFVVVTGQSL
ncbi:MAG: hypothetical protein U5K43_14780 [Halofilum sp. (in: g-proteobacteria)]|nr:hypothetical protein [Halofilum sp. (in: g-proteobacteria)]